MIIKQKIREIGSSLGILLPSAFIKFKGLKAGDLIEIDSKHIKKLKGGKGKNE